jgi:hypothetical protein
MPKSTPFFQGFNRHLFGRKPLTQIESLRRQQARVDTLSLRLLQRTFGRFLPLELLKGASPQRRCPYTPLVTFSGFLWQVLDPASSCRKAVTRVQALCREANGRVVSPATGAFCLARANLSVRLLSDVARELARRLVAHRAQSGARFSMLGRLFVVDGTAVSMPDTPENQSRYPQQRSQQPGLGFPMMKLAGLFDLRSGAWIAVARGTLRSHETLLWRRLFRRLRPEDTVITDRGFCSYFTAAELMRRGVHFVMRNHARRKSDFRTGTRLGRNDHLITWERPQQRPSWMTREEFHTMPRTLRLRETKYRITENGFRTREVILVTSHIDVQILSSDTLADLYMERWRVELFFDDIKTTLQMDVLRTKSPRMICRELLMHMIAYNLIRALILRAGADQHRASFKGTVDRLVFWSGPLLSTHRACRARAIVDQLLKDIALDLIPLRPNRREPRAVKRRPKSYHLLTAPRHKMVDVPHRN